MQLKKSFVIIIAVLAVLAVMIPFVSADEIAEPAYGFEATISNVASAPVADRPNVGEGDVIEVTAAMTKNAGLKSLKYSIDYDPEVLEVLKDETGVKFVNFTPVDYINFNEQNGKLIINILFSLTKNDSTYEGDLIKVYFVVKATTHKDVEISVGEFKANGKDIAGVEAIEYVAMGHGTGIVVDEAVAPTCTETGLTIGAHCACAGCEAVLVAQETIEALGHIEIVDKGYAATCTEAGLTDGKHCERCEAVLVAQEPIEALGHDYDAVVTNPTCTEAGYTTHTCSRCGDAYTDAETAALGHDFVELVDEAYVKTAVDCESPAVFFKSCSRCGIASEETFENGEKLGHNYMISDTLLPDCVNGGYTEYTCVRCGDSYKVEADALGHSYTAETAEEKYLKAVADCTNAAVYYKSCHRCGVASDTLTFAYGEALGHTEVIDAAVAATCTETGLTEGKHCSVCEAVIVKQEVVAALGHKAGEAVKENVVDATCTAEGSYDEVVYCTVCGTELSRESKVIDIIAHTEVIDAAVAATCTETGLTEGKHCSVCNTVLVAQETVEALGHKAGEAVKENVVDATCTVAGSYDEVVYCTVCEAELSRENKAIEVIAHTEVIDAAVAATCTETGLTEGKHCSVCNTVLVAQEVVPATGHDYKISDVVFPTCTKGGYTTHVCENCGDSYNDNETSALGHDIVVKAAVDATAFGEGKTEGRVCNRCGEVLAEQQILPALGIATAWWFWVIIAVVVVAVVVCVVVVIIKKKKAN